MSATVSSRRLVPKALRPDCESLKGVLVVLFTNDVNLSPDIDSGDLEPGRWAYVSWLRLLRGRSLLLVHRVWPLHPLLPVPGILRLSWLGGPLTGRSVQGVLLAAYPDGHMSRRFEPILEGFPKPESSHYYLPRCSWWLTRPPALVPDCARRLFAPPPAGPEQGSPYHVARFTHSAVMAGTASTAGLDSLRLQLQVSRLAASRMRSARRSHLLRRQASP